MDLGAHAAAARTGVSVSLERTAGALGLTGLYLFAAFAWLGKAGANAGLLLMVIALVLDRRRFVAVFRHHPLTVLFALFVGLVSFQAYRAAAEFPQFEQWDAARQWLAICLFIPVAWWTGGNSKRVTIIMLLAFGGFAVKALQAVDWDRWRGAHYLLRSGFGFPEISAGLIAGVGILAVVMLFSRIDWQKSRTMRGGSHAALLLALYIVLGEVLVVSQSRAAWAATAVGVLALLPFLMSKPSRGGWGRSVAMATIVIGLLAALLAVNWGTIEKRTSREQGVFRALVAGTPVENIPFNSAGRRVHMVHFGVGRWLERPWLGWGPATPVTKAVSARALDEPFARKQLKRLKIHPHLHNTYLSVLARLGLAGGLILAAVVWLVARGTWRERRRGAMEREVWLFFVAAFVTVAIWNLGSFRIINSEYRTLMLLLLGSAFSFELERLKHAYTASRT